MNTRPHVESPQVNMQSLSLLGPLNPEEAIRVGTFLHQELEQKKKQTTNPITSNLYSFKDCDLFPYQPKKGGMEKFAVTANNLFHAVPLGKGIASVYEVNTTIKLLPLGNNQFSIVIKNKEQNKKRVVKVAPVKINPALKTNNLPLNLAEEETRISKLIDHLHYKDSTYVNSEFQLYRLNLLKRLPGRTLLSFINDIRQNNKKLSIEETYQVILNLITGLRKQIHAKGLIHCDIKPENIFIDESNNNAIYYFDLGLAEDVSAQKTTHGGTPEFASSEQIDKETLSEKTDLYALAKIIGLLLKIDVPMDMKYAFNDILFSPYQLRKFNDASEFNLEVSSKEALVQLLENMLKCNQHKRPTVKQAIGEVKKIFAGYFKNNQVLNLAKLQQIEERFPIFKTLREKQQLPWWQVSNFLAAKDLNAFEKKRHENDFNEAIKNFHDGMMFDMYEIVEMLNKKNSDDVSHQTVQTLIKKVIDVYLQATLTEKNILNAQRSFSGRRINDIKKILKTLSKNKNTHDILNKLEKQILAFQKGWQGFGFFADFLGGSKLGDDLTIAIKIARNTLEGQKNRALNTSS